MERATMEETTSLIDQLQGLLVFVSEEDLLFPIVLGQVFLIDRLPIHI